MSLRKILENRLETNLCVLDACLTPGNPVTQMSLRKIFRNRPETILCVLDACLTPGNPVTQMSLRKILENRPETNLCVLDACLMPGNPVTQTSLRKIFRNRPETIIGENSARVPSPQGFHQSNFGRYHQMGHEQSGSKVRFPILPRCSRTYW